VFLVVRLIKQNDIFNCVILDPSLLLNIRNSSYLLNWSLLNFFVCDCLLKLVKILLFLLFFAGSIDVLTININHFTKNSSEQTGFAGTNVTYHTYELAFLNCKINILEINKILNALILVQIVLTTL